MGKKNKKTTTTSAAAAGPRRGGAAAFLVADSAAADVLRPADDADASDDTPSSANANADTSGQRFALYQRAVQHPAGDLSWALKFHRLYSGVPGAVPLHLREDFSGTSLLAAHWLRGSPLRSALGVDLDRDALAWGHAHNFQGLVGGGRACLVHANVLDEDLKGAALVPPRRRRRKGDDEEDDNEEEDEEEKERLRVLRRRADLVLAMNYCVCLMRTRADAVRYLRIALKALTEGRPSSSSVCDGDGDTNPGPSTGLLLFDLLGGRTVERAGVAFDRRNAQTGGRFRWEQARFDPFSRRLRSHLRLLPAASKSPAAAAAATFTYDWRLWTLPEAIDLLREAGHAGDVRVWVRRVREDDGGATVAVAGGGGGVEREEGREQGEDDDDDEEDEYVEYRPGGAGVDLSGMAEGWSAYVVAVVRRR